MLPHFRQYRPNVSQIDYYTKLYMYVIIYIIIQQDMQRSVRYVNALLSYIFQAFHIPLSLKGKYLVIYGIHKTNSKLIFTDGLNILID